MANITPSDWFTGYTFDGANLNFPLAAFNDLSAAKANAATGDIREIIKNILTQVAFKYNALGGLKPTKMVALHGYAYPAVPGNPIEQSFTITFIFVSVDNDVIAEP